MDCILLSRGRRADASSPRPLPGGSNTFILAGEMVLVQKTWGGSAVEARLVPAGPSCPAGLSLREGEIRYEARSGRYLLRLGGETFSAWLPEPVVAPARTRVGPSFGPVRLSCQKVSTGPLPRESL